MIDPNGPQMDDASKLGVIAMIITGGMMLALSHCDGSSAHGYEPAPVKDTSVSAVQPAKTAPQIFKIG